MKLLTIWRLSGVTFVEPLRGVDHCEGWQKLPGHLGMFVEPRFIWGFYYNFTN